MRKNNAGFYYYRCLSRLGVQNPHEALLVTPVTVLAAGVRRTLLYSIVAVMRPVYSGLKTYPSRLVQEWLFGYLGQISCQ